MTIEEIGKLGERIIREWIKKEGKGYIWSPDWIWENEIDEDKIIEVKHQEIFIPGKNFPYYGHGLDLRQAISYMKFYNKHEIPIMLMIIELSNYKKKKGKHLIWWAYLHKLEKTKYYDTGGNRGHGKKRVYNIEYFKHFYILI